MILIFQNKDLRSEFIEHTQSASEMKEIFSNWYLVP